MYIAHYQWQLGCVGSPYQCHAVNNECSGVTIPGTHLFNFHLQVSNLLFLGSQGPPIGREGGTERERERGRDRERRGRERGSKLKQREREKQREGGRDIEGEGGRGGERERQTDRQTETRQSDNL